MAKRSGINVTGVPAVLRAFVKMAPKVGREISKELRTVIGPDALGEMVRRAPVDEGTLRGSHSMHLGGERIATGADFGGDAAGATPADGGQDSGPMTLTIVANTVYAMYQHETVELNHPKGGEAKWMERVLNENRGQYEKRIAAAVERGTAR